MTITMDKSGRIVIPKRVREKAGLSPGTPLEIDGDENGIRIAAKPGKWEVVKDGHGYVARRVDGNKGPPITTEMVNRMLEEDRMRSIRNFR